MTTSARVTINTSAPTALQDQNLQARLGILSRLMAEANGVRGTGRSISPYTRQTPIPDMPPPPYTAAAAPIPPSTSHIESVNNANSSTDISTNSNSLLFPAELSDFNFTDEEEAEEEEEEDNEGDSSRTATNINNTPTPTTINAWKPEPTHHAIEIDASTQVSGSHNDLCAKSQEQNSLLAARIATALAAILQGEMPRPRRQGATETVAGPAEAVAGTTEAAAARASTAVEAGNIRDVILGNLPAANPAVLNGDKPIHIKLKCGLVVDGEYNTLGQSVNGDSANSPNFQRSHRPSCDYDYGDSSRRASSSRPVASSLFRPRDSPSHDFRSSPSNARRSATTAAARSGSGLPRPSRRKRRLSDSSSAVELAREGRYEESRYRPRVRATRMDRGY